MPRPSIDELDRQLMAAIRAGYVEATYELTDEGLALAHERCRQHEIPENQDDAVLMALVTYNDPHMIEYDDGSPAEPEGWGDSER